MSVKFVIDSASDVLPEEAKAMGVAHLPLQVMFGEETFDDAVSLSHREFFEKLTTSKALPTTSQITPAAFDACYRQLTAGGDSVVVITISSKLSGTYQSAVIAAEDYPDQVYVVDSLSATIGERVLLQRGMELAKQGCSAREIAATLNEEKGKIRVIAIVDTLEYLKKGGRISAATAVAGTLLSIKPAIMVQDGEVAMAGTARGTRKGNQLLRELIEKHGGVNFNKPVALVYSGLEDTLLRKFIEDTPALWQGRTELPAYSLGCAIGTHVGPGAYGIALFEE